MSTQNSPEVYVPSEIYAPDGAEVSFDPPLKHRYWLHLLLLGLTFFTTLVVGARLQWNFLVGLPPFTLGNEIFPVRWALQGNHLLLGLPFSLTLMLILLAHEMGHYLYCVRYGVSATLPFFIPFPTLIGTLGAFIRIKSPLRSRAVLFDIGIAGPIAGFLVALVVLIFSLGLSRIAPVGAFPPDIQLGYPLIFHLVRRSLVAAGYAHGVANVPLEPSVFASGGDSRMGRNVRDFIEPASRRPARRRTHRVRGFSARAPHHFTNHNSHTHSSGALFLDGMAGLGGAAANQWNATPFGSGLAGNHDRTPLARGLCPADAGADLRLHSDFTRRRAAVGN